MKKSRIVFIIHALNMGGAERIVVSLLNHINRDHYDIHLIVFNTSGAFFSDISSDVKVHDLNISSATKGVFPLLLKLYKLKPDIVFSGIGYLNALLSITIPVMNRLLSKKPTWIARETSIVSIIIKKERFTKVFEWLYRHSYKNFDTIICQSKYMSEDLQNNYLLPLEKIVVINNPVDAHKIDILATKPIPYTFNKNTINLLAVGALRPVKRFDLLLKLMSYLDDHYKLTLVGGGVEEAKLKQLAHDLGVEKSVSFEGHQSNPYAYMNQADVLLLSSEYEGFPNVILEANSCGLPVIAFACPGGTSEIIKEGITGKLVPCQDIQALIDAVRNFEKVHYDRDFLKKYINKNYRIGKIIQQYEVILK